MAINPNIPLQVRTPQFAPTLANLVQTKTQNQQRDRQLDIQERSVSTQEQALSQRANARPRPSEEQIGRAYLATGMDVDAAGRMIDQGNIRGAMELMLVAEERMAQLGEDTTGLQRVMRLTKEDPEQGSRFISEHLRPMLKKIVGGESNMDRKIVGLVQNGQVTSLLDDGQGGFYDMQNRPFQIPEGAQIVESVSLQAANAGDLSNSQREKLSESEIATRQFLASTGDLVSMLQGNQDINTTVAGAASVVNGLRQEVEALGRLIGRDFDANQLNPEQYDFEGLGDMNARTKSLVTSLAYARARINDPGGRLSERDVQAAIREIGGNLSDPQAFIAVLQDVGGRADRDFRIRYSTLLGEQFEGDLGLEAFKQTNVQDLSDEDLLNF